MKLYKLSQGSTFDNLKHFIYITNEYGVPSAEFVDDFINQFGKVILNGNFIFSQTQVEQLDTLWSDIVKECTYNNIEYKKTYGSTFYIILHQKAILKIKEGYEQSEWIQLKEQDKLELLKQFIIDFDKYKDEFIEIQREATNTQKYNYKITNEMYIGHELTIKESVDSIVASQYKAKVLDDVNIQLADIGQIININKFIEEAEGRGAELTIKMGFFKFEFIYKEKKEE